MHIKPLGLKNSQSLVDYFIGTYSPFLVYILILSLSVTVIFCLTYLLFTQTKPYYINTSPYLRDVIPALLKYFDNLSSD